MLARGGAFAGLATRIAPTAMGEAAYFDRIELLKSLEEESSARKTKETR
jgi:hypothetical protein